MRFEEIPVGKFFIFNTRRDSLFIKESLLVVKALVKQGRDFREFYLNEEEVAMFSTFGSVFKTQG